MKIEVNDWTIDPIDEIAVAAGTSYGHMDPSIKRVKRCFDNGHMSVFEFAHITFYIEGISRACSHQLVRHRHMSFVQKSQRYTTLDCNDWYVIPPAFEENNVAHDFRSNMEEDRQRYENALRAGIKPEDARFLLPEATKTDISVSTNLRELFHFLDLRCDKSAQWEIRELANAMKDTAKEISPQWRTLIEMWEEKCLNQNG